MEEREEQNLILANTVSCGAAAHPQQRSQHFQHGVKDSVANVKMMPPNQRFCYYLTYVTAQSSLNIHAVTPFPEKWRMQENGGATC